MKKNDRTTEYLAAYADEAPDRDRTLKAARAVLRQKADRKKRSRFATLFPVFASVAAVAVVLVLGISGLVRLFAPAQAPGDGTPAPSYYTAADVGYRNVTRERAEQLTGIDFGETENATFRLYSFKTGGDALVYVKLRVAKDYGYDEIALWVELTDRAYRPIAELFATTGTFYENGEYVTRATFADVRSYLQIMSPNGDAHIDYLPQKNI